jgi:putative transposase
MKRKSVSVQPDLFEQNRPGVLLVPLHKEQLAALVKAMTHHPHVHMIVPGGGISLDDTHWVSCRPGFFLPYASCRACSGDCS